MSSRAPVPRFPDLRFEWKARDFATVDELWAHARDVMTAPPVQITGPCSLRLYPNVSQRRPKP